MLGKYMMAAVLLMAVGCDEAQNDEVGRLKTRIHILEQENQALRVVAPTEQPAIVKELAEAKAEIMRLSGELTHARETMIPDVQPLSAALRDLRARLGALEKSASRKGHTHQYRDTDGKTFEQTTGPDK